MLCSDALCMPGTTNSCKRKQAFLQFFNSCDCNHPARECGGAGCQGVDAVNKRDSLGRWIAALFRYGRAYVEIEMKPHGIGKGQFPFLIRLLRDDGCSQDELAESLLMDKTVTARALAKLEKQGFILRRMDAHDSRIKRVYVTDKTRAIREEIFAAPRNWTRVLVRGFTPEERATALDLLERMAANAGREIKDMAERRGV